MDRFQGTDQSELYDMMAQEQGVAADYTEELEVKQSELNARILLQEQINYELSKKQAEESESF